MTDMLGQYEAVTPAGTVEFLRQLGRRLEGTRLLHVNSTRYGGGVAEMLHRLVPLFEELGIRTRWEIMTGSDLFYQATKSFHNALQGTLNESRKPCSMPTSKRIETISNGWISMRMWR